MHLPVLIWWIALGSYIACTFPRDLETPPFHPLCRALSSHTEVSLFCANKEASTLSLASSHVSIPELHLSASFWYWDVIFLASSNATSECCCFSNASDSRSFSSSDNSSAKLFCVSSLTSGSRFAQSVKHERDIIPNNTKQPYANNMMILWDWFNI